MEYFINKGWPLFCVISFIIFWCPCDGQLESLYPVNVTDTNDHHAGENSSITWGPLPASAFKYKSDTTARDLLPGMATFQSMVNAFTYVVQPDDPPYDLILALMDGSAQIMDNILELLKFGAGIAVCFIIGIFFIFLVPIIGCCFCCCRCCCGKCGAKLSKDDSARSSCRCRFFGIFLFLTSLTMVIGIILVYVTTVEFKQMVEDVEGNAKDTFSDVKLFIRNTVDEIDFVGGDGFQFTRAVVTRDLDNVGFLIGKPIREELDQTAGVSALVNRIYALDLLMGDLVSRMEDIDGDTTSLQTKGTDLGTELTAWRATIATIQGGAGCAASCAAVVTTNVDTDADFSLLPALSTQLVNFQTLAAKDLAGSAQSGKQDFDDIPKRVFDDTKTEIADIKQQMTDFEDTITKSLSDLTDIPQQVDDPIDGLVDQITDISDMMKSFETYRFYAGIALVSILGIIVALQIVAIFLACCNYNADIHPSQRSSCSHCSGNCLMAAVGLSFIFSWILMILVTFPFVIGTPLDRDLCDPLTSSELTVFEKLIDKPGGLFGDKYLMADILLGNGSIPLTVSDTLKGCKKDYPAYTVLKLENKMNLTKLTAYKEEIEVEKSLNAMNVDFSDVSIISADTIDQLDDLKVLSQIPASAFQTILSTATTKTDLTTFATSVRAVANDGSNTDPAKSALLLAADDLDQIETDHNVPTTTLKTSLLSDINTYESLSTGIPAEVDGIKADASTTEGVIHSDAPVLFNDAVPEFSSRLFGTLDAYADYVDGSIRALVGHCEPIWTVWETLVHKTICTSVVGTLNGFWFSLGWCVFLLVPSMILSVKLAKHLRKMKCEGTNPVNISSGGSKNRAQVHSGDPRRRNKINPSMGYCAHCQGSACASCGRVVLTNHPNAAFSQPPPMYSEA